ncbi:MAG: FAD binding domain-containing protein [Rectinemataceae bacterium]
MLASEVHYPEEISQVLALLESTPDALIFAGGTGILRDRADRIVELPPTVLCIHKIAELKRVNRTERFLEVGSLVTISALLDLAASGLPEPLPRVASEISVHPIRNMATLGGNLACPDRFMDLWPILACMDASVELRNASGTRWVNLNRLAGPDGKPGFPRATLLTRIRIPLESADFLVAERTGAKGYPAGDSRRFICIANTGRGAIDSFRLAYAGTRFFRNRELEASLTGRKLPLPAKDAELLGGQYIESLSAEWGETIFEYEALIGSLFRRLSR